MTTFYEIIKCDTKETKARVAGMAIKSIMDQFKEDLRSNLLAAE